MIIRGKDKGETGAIKRVVRSQNRVIVEGKNLVGKVVYDSCFVAVILSCYNSVLVSCFQEKGKVVCLCLSLRKQFSG